MATKNFRYLHQNERARIEHDLVLTRMGELMMRNFNAFTKAFFYSIETPGLEAIAFNGLVASPGTGLQVLMSVWGAAAQKIVPDDIKICMDGNGGSAWAINLAAADPSQPRIDIIEARIEEKLSYRDASVDIVDPVSKTITPQLRYRDREVYLNIVKKDGTPGSSTAPATTAATQGKIVGTVDIVSTIDLSSQYILNLGVGADSELVEVDCRGATPAATTKNEIVAAINGAGFGTVAVVVSDHIEISAPGLGENSVVKIKQPSNPDRDAYAEILGGPEALGYYEEHKGANAFFKLAEVFVPAGAVSLSPDYIKTRFQKGDWTVGATTIMNGLSFEAHRDAAVIDHPDASVTFAKLAPDVIIAINSKKTLYRGVFAPIYPKSGDTTGRLGTVFRTNIECSTAGGATQAITEQEQVNAVRRVDNKQEEYTNDYNVLASLSELSADKIPFSPTIGLLFSTAHARTGFYVKSIGSGYDAIRVMLHDDGNNVVAQGDVAIANIATGWNYVDVVGTLSAGVNYHYHIYLVNFGTGTTPVIGMNAVGTITHREMYKPSAGKYYGANGPDVVRILKSDGDPLVPYRAPNDDDITTPGTGYVGGSGLDVMAVDLSNDTTWENWQYNEYVGIDLATGRVKLPSGYSISDYYVEFNTVVGISDIDAKNIMMHGETWTVEDFLRAKFPDNTSRMVIDTIDGTTPIGGVEVSGVKLNDGSVTSDGDIICENGNFIGTFAALDSLSERVGATERLNLSQELRLAYLEQSQQIGSERLVELFFTKDLVVSNLEGTGNIVAPIFSDSDAQNNWKARIPDPSYKNGFIRNRLGTFMGETIDTYDMRGIGMTYKSGLSKFDIANNCYWAVTYRDNNLPGEILKLARSMPDGKVQIVSRYGLPAPGTGNWWSGIDVDTNGTRLWFCVMGNNGLAESKVYGIKINSDGSLGEAAYKVYPGQEISLVNSCYAVHAIANAGVDIGYYNDVTEWDDDTICVLAVYPAGSGSPATLVRLDKANLGDSIQPDITGLGNGGFVNRNTTSTAWGCSVKKYGNDLWLRRIDNGNDLWWIYRINLTDDIKNNVVVSCSSRFESWFQEDEVGNGGISISFEGDLLELCQGRVSTAVVIARRSLKGAKWAENQVDRCLVLWADPDKQQKTASCMESDRYFWTADWAATANQVDLFRYDTQDGTVKHCRLTDSNSLTGVHDIEINPAGKLMMTTTGTGGMFVYWGDASALVAIMGNSYNASLTKALGTDWGTRVNPSGFPTAKNFYGLAWDGDASKWLLLNDTDDKIDTLSADVSAYTTGVYDIAAPASGVWAGIAYKNGKIHIGECRSDGQPHQIFVLDKEKSTSDAWLRIHQYQDGAFTFQALGSQCLSFWGDDLIRVSVDTGALKNCFYAFRVKTIENPLVMQMNWFIFYSHSGGTAINPYSLAMSSFISCMTPIKQRKFKPEQYSDPLNVPDNFFMGVGFAAAGGQAGMSIFHLDEMFEERTSEGLPRYDVRKIRKWDCFAYTGADYQNAGNFICTDLRLSCIEIRDDIIVVQTSVTTNNMPRVILNLKTGLMWCQGRSLSGMRYNGSWSERNLGKGWKLGVYNPQFDVSGNVGSDCGASSYTFSKGDKSDYDYENKRTYFCMSNTAGLDVLVMLWGTGDNAYPETSWRNVFNGAWAQQPWLAPSGVLFCGGTNEYLYRVRTPHDSIYGASGNNYRSSYVWNIVSDAYGQIQVGPGFGSIVTAIAPHSYCYRNPSGEWRHFPMVFGYEGTYKRIMMYDSENGAAFEQYFADWATATGPSGGDVWEDMMFVPFYNTVPHFTILKRLKFADWWSASTQVGFSGYLWTPTRRCNGKVNWGNGTNFSRPYFALYSTLTWPRLYWSPKMRMLMMAYNTTGMNAVVHTFEMTDACEYMTKEIDLSYNPTSALYIASESTPYSEVTVDE